VDIGRIRVLIVDDDASMRITMAASLEHCDTQVAASGREAIECMAMIDFDVVVCDLVMPEMTGAELYASLPADSPFRSRFLFMTGGALPVAIQSFLALTSVPLLRKPFRVKDLREAVWTVATS
jgi:CheY-like chemotaxis protein